MIVAIPGGVPTGAVFNSSGGGFVVSNGTTSAPAVFLFSSETGIISGWNSATGAQVGATVADAIYKGLAIAGTGADARLYATNFHAGTVDVFDNAFHLLSLPGAFVDPNLPAGFAPFGIQAIGGTIYVTYAMQDADKEDEVAGAGLGYVDAYDTAGNLLRRVASADALNAPWGLALAPLGFGEFGGALLVGNFGDGTINAFDPRNGRFLGTLRDQHHMRIRVDGLWGMAFGNGVAAQKADSLYYAAGPNDEENGAYGVITPIKRR